MTAMTAVTVIPMREHHLDTVVAIELQSSPEPWSRGIFDEELRDTANRSFHVAVTDGVVVGFCSLLMQLSEGHIANIAVEPAMRGRRVGARLLLQAARVAIARGATAMTLEVRVSNVGARRLYQWFGFAPAGVRPRYYRSNNEDALIMWAHDVDTAAFAQRLAAIALELDREPDREVAS